MKTFKVRRVGDKHWDDIEATDAEDAAEQWADENLTDEDEEIQIKGHGKWGFSAEVIFHPHQV